MCPACIATATWIVAGATSAGGLAALVVERLRETASRPECRDQEPKSAGVSISRSLVRLTVERGLTAGRDRRQAELPALNRTERDNDASHDVGQERQQRESGQALNPASHAVRTYHPQP